MKKVRFICRAALAVVFIMTCKAPEFENPIMREWWPEDNGDLDGVGGLDSEVPDIIKATPSVNWPSNLTAVAGQKLSDVKLPGNGTSAPSGTFTWTRPTDPVGSHGIQTHNMTFTPNDTLNYNTLKKDIAVAVMLVKMVYIPAGNFIMGSNDNEKNDDETQHHVTLTSGFYMSECQVTQKLYVEFLNYNPSLFKALIVGEDGTPGMRPVERVSWYDALVFCNELSMAEGLSPAYSISGSTDPDDWGPIPAAKNTVWDAVAIVPNSNGYRLPTEAQWEYACRAGTTTTYHTGDTLNTNAGWYGYNSGGETHQTGLKHANAWGLYDMTGNVWEWCWDWYEKNYGIMTQIDPMGPSSGHYRVLRGGSFLHQSVFLRSAFRNYNEPYYSNPEIGLRLVRP